MLIREPFDLAAGPAAVFPKGQQHRNLLRGKTKMSGLPDEAQHLDILGVYTR